MNEILKTVLSFLATIITAFLIYIFSKKLDLKLEKRLEKIEENIKHILHEFELDETVDTYMTELYKYLNYLYKKNINKENIEVVEEMCNKVIIAVINIFRADALKRECAEQVEMMITATKDNCILNYKDTV